MALPVKSYNSVEDCLMWCKDVVVQHGRVVRRRAESRRWMTDAEERHRLQRQIAADRRRFSSLRRRSTRLRRRRPRASDVRRASTASFRRASYRSFASPAQRARPAATHRAAGPPLGRRRRSPQSSPTSRPSYTRNPTPPPAPPPTLANDFDA